MTCETVSRCYPNSLAPAQRKKHFSYVGNINLIGVVAALEIHRERFKDEIRRQTYAGTAHPDSETIYLRMPPVITLESIFQSLDVADCPMVHQPVFRQITDQICAKVGPKMARAMIVKLKPHGRILPHVDEGAYADASDRYHLPLATNDGAWLKSGDERKHLPVGELWWFDKHAIHEGANDGETDRVHLIVDFFRSENAR